MDKQEISDMAYAILIVKNCHVHPVLNRDMANSIADKIVEAQAMQTSKAGTSHKPPRVSQAEFDEGWDM